MNRRHVISSLMTCALALPALAHAYHDGDVEIDIVNADGRKFSTFPVDNAARDVHRAYLEARNREPYRIRVRNRGARRVGVVIAVDGRNIISGDRSELGRNERMYVLDPWESAEYEGWRTATDRVHEFYFTDWHDSYAEAFGDRSARGVIALAVYREREYGRELHGFAEPESKRDTGAADAARAPAPSEERARAASQPGTGFGDEVYSPSRRVRFDPEQHAASRHFIKYEWRDSLCRRGVIDCGDRERNRFWDEGERYGFAPHPPKRGWR
jgi:hypothetical protein